MVKGMPTVCPMTPRAVVEAQFVAALVGDSAVSEERRRLILYSTPRKDLPNYAIPISPLPIIRC